MTSISITSTDEPALSGKAIGHALGAMLKSFDEEDLQTYSAIANTQEAQQAVDAVRRGDINQFHFAMQKLYPADKVIDGLLASEFPNPMTGTTANDLRFLFKHGKFVDYHVQRLVETYEGGPCSADKTRSILRGVLRFLKTGDEIVFNFEQEYTYHLPEFVFTEHQTTLQFFKSLQNLYYGNPDDYLHALLAVRRAADERRLQYNAAQNVETNISSLDINQPERILKWQHFKKSQTN